MSKLYLESTLRAVVRKFVDPKVYSDIFERLKTQKCVDAIPVGYIRSYAASHDPVCSANMEQLLESYSKLQDEEA